MATIAEWWMWVGFLSFIFIMIFFDLFVLGGRKAHVVTFKEALAWSLAWFVMALLFNLLLWWYLQANVSLALANEKALEFLTGYVIEKSLAVDNIFVFMMIFTYFAVPAEYQRRVLIYGVITAVVLRLIMILLGGWLITKFHWVLYLFGLFLVMTGIKMFIFANQKPDLSKNSVLRGLRKHLRVTEDYHGERFFVRKNKIWYFTPLFLVLIFIELSDVAFAVDSVPAIYAITSDPFIVATSNIFAVLGLRALYFMLVGVADRFQYLKYGLALILVCVGIKLLIAGWVKVPVIVSLLVVAVILAASILISVYHHKRLQIRV